MKFDRRRWMSAATLTVAMVTGAGLSAAPAFAAYDPANPPYPADPFNVASVTIYDSTTGAAVTTGSSTVALSSYYFVASSDFEPGHTRAAVFGYLAETGKAPGAFSGQSLGPSTIYPATTAPAPVNGFNRPVAKGSTSSTFETLTTAFPNTASSSSDFYQLYQLRVRTTVPSPASDNYAYADVQIDPTAHTWKQVAPAAAASTAPGAPTGVTATAGDASATVGWTAPASDGGSVITKYTVTAVPTSGTTVTKDVTGATSTSLTGLVNGTTYSVTVTATNTAGTSPASTPAATVTPVAAATAPGAPTGVTATAGDMSADVSWTAPASDGGSAITKYTVTAVPTSGTAVTKDVTGATSTSLTLVNGKTYSVTVKALNAIGASPASSPAVSVSPTAAPTAPGAPTGVTATPGDSSASVSWSAPVNDGGSAITMYTVTAVPTSGTTVTKDVTGATSTSLTGLVNGTTYSVTVTATNAIGTSAASSPGASVTPVAPTAPGAPTGVTATAGNASATVSWSAPASNGGSAITKYTVTAVPASGTTVTKDVTGATSTTLTGLVNGTTYSVTVTATNGVGTSPASSPAADVTPAVQQVKTGLALAASNDEPTAGDDFALAGRLVGGNNAGQSVIVYGYTDDTDKASSAVVETTGSDGRFKLVLKARRNTIFKAVFHATATQLAAVSPEVEVDVDYRVTVFHPIANNTRTAARSVTITGALFPGDAGTDVVLVLRNAAGGSVIGSATVGTNGRFTIKHTFAKGTYLLQVFAASDDQIGGSRLFRVIEV